MSCSVPSSLHDKGILSEVAHESSFGDRLLAVLELGLGCSLILSEAFLKVNDAVAIISQSVHQNPIPKHIKSSRRVQGSERPFQCPILHRVNEDVTIRGGQEQQVPG